MTVAPAPDLDVSHPAKFSQEVLEAIDLIVPEGARVLDPFAGVGYIHRLEGRETWGIELEPEWGEVHPRTLVGNALTMPFPDSSWRWVVTSCTYGNRMADHHDARERCKACRGNGKTITGYLPEGQALTDGTPCQKCEGRGFRSYKRLTYRHQLGRELHPENSGQLQWGPKYRAFHERAWDEVWRVLEYGGRFVLNLKNHHRDKEVARVMEWHLNDLVRRGFTLLQVEVVETQGMGMGQNRDARESHEFVLVFERN